MGIIRISDGRRVKRRKLNVAEQRDLALQWEKICASHARPLERGAQAKNVVVKPVKVKVSKAVKTKVVAPVHKPMALFVATKPVVDPLAQAKRDLAPRVGQAFNKGGLQYLSDDDMAEQKTGAHKRRT